MTTSSPVVFGLVMSLLFCACLRMQAAEPRRARDLGLIIGELPIGMHNAITDVPGVLVGHETLIEGQDVRTGVTAIVPHAGNLLQEKVPAAVVVGNAFGKLVGSTQVNELGTLETPIVLTNTLSTFAAADALVGYMLSLEGNETVGSVNPVVGETNDGFLNDIRARNIRPAHVLAALHRARGGPVAEGCVGAGTGTRCLGWKGGIGTSSRRLPDAQGGYTLGMLVQTNFGGMLTVNGAPVGRELGKSPQKSDAGSCMLILATDAPLDHRQLLRVARRALLGLGAVGSVMSHGSGDFVIAFATAQEVRVPYASRERTQAVTLLRDERLTPLFQAACEATEEAILNSMFQATTMTGYRGHVSQAIPLDRVVEICKWHRVLAER